MNIGVVIVTYNRVNLLKKTLTCYEKQSYRPDFIIVVDNKSTDNTAEYLKTWEKEKSDINHIVLSLNANMGGSGGFYEGIKLAREQKVDWIWIADDDAFIHEEALEQLNKFVLEHESMCKDVVAICSENSNDQGQIATGHRCRKKSWHNRPVPVSNKEYCQEYFDIDIFSFVGTAIKRDIIVQEGLPMKEFFIYADDYEYSLRIKKNGRILCVPAIKVTHNDNSGVVKNASWRDYYETRNNLWVIKKYYGNFAYYTRIICRLLTAMKSLNPEKIKVYQIAISDAKNDKLGIHEVFRPGWQPSHNCK